jgi:hypothetical protein
VAFAREPAQDLPEAPEEAAHDRRRLPESTTTGASSPIIYNKDGSVNVRYESYQILVPPEKLKEIQDTLQAHELKAETRAALLQSMLESAAREEARSTLERRTMMHQVAWAALGVGIVSAVAGGIFLSRMVSKYDQSQPYCDGSRCREPGFSNREDAIGAGNSATLFFAISVISLLGAGASWMFAPSLTRAETYDRTSDQLQAAGWAFRGTW